MMISRFLSIKIFFPFQKKGEYFYLLKKLVSIMEGKKKNTEKLFLRNQGFGRGPPKKKPHSIVK